MSIDRIAKLLEQSEIHSDLFTNFIDSRDCNEVGWLHDIKVKRFGEGSRRLQEVAAKETYLDRRITIASLSKLLFLAEGTCNSLVHEGTASYAARCNEELNTLTTQVDVANFWEEQVGAMVSIPDKADAILKKLGSPLLAEQNVLRKVSKLPHRLPSLS
jgi:hypothetical protein